LVKKFFDNYKAAYSGLPKAAWMLSFVVLINRSGSMVLFFMTLYLTKELDYPIATAGRMVSIFGLGSLAGSLLGGWLTDIFGSLKVQLLSLFWGGIGFIVLCYANSLIEIGIPLFIIAMIGEAFRPANIAAISQVCPAGSQARGFALIRLAVNLGVVVGPALGGFLATINYKFLFWVDGLTCIVAAWLLWLFFRKTKYSQISTENQNATPNRSPLRDGIFVSLLFLVVAVAFVFAQLFNTWPIYLRQVYKLFEDQIGLLLTLNASIVVLIEMPLIHKLENKNPLQIIAYGALFLAGGFALLPYGISYFYAAFTVTIWTFGEILVFPLIASFIANRTSDNNRGKYMGLFTFSFSLAFVIGPVAGTWIYDIHGPNLLWMIIGVLGIAIWLGFFILDHYLKREKRDSR